MSLRAKAYALAFIQLVVIAAAVFVAGSAIVRWSVAQSEAQDAREAVGHVLGAFDLELTGMAVTAKDWATWTQTHDFVRRRFDGYVGSNLSDDIFPNLRLSAMLFYDTRGRLVHGEGYDLASGRRGPPEPTLLEALAGEDGRLHLSAPFPRGASGVLARGRVRYLVVAQPIMKNNDVGPAAGTLVMARQLGPEEFDRLRRIAGIPFTMLRASLSLPEDSREAMPRLLSAPAVLGPAPVVATPLDETRISGNALARDISGAPTHVIRVIRPRTDLATGKRSIRILGLSLVLMGIAAGGLAAQLWERFLFGRLGSLSRSIAQVGMGSDPKARVAVTGSGDDELGRLAGVVNGALDAVERAEHESAEKDRRFASVIDGASDCVFFADASSRKLIRANDAFYRHLGYDTGDLGELTLEDVLGEDAEQVHRAVKEAAGESRHFLGEHHCVREDGAELDVEVSANLVRFNGGEAILVIARDVTDRRRLEQLKADFTSMISHELRTPLTSIIGFADLLARGLDPAEEDDPRRSRAVYQIQRRAEDMRRLVEDLLNVSRMQADGLVLMDEPVDVAELVHVCAERTRLTPRHDLVVDVDEDVPTIRGDSERLGYALSNLLANAVKFSPEGGPVKVTARRTGPTVTIEVRDEGVGIPPDALAHAFDRYAQADMTSTRAFGGFGLGLYVARELVQAHGGDITVRSVPGRGSTFAIILPLGAVTARESAC